MAIPYKFPESSLLGFYADLWWGLPHQCAHWFAMTCVFDTALNYNLSKKYPLTFALGYAKIPE